MAGGVVEQEYVRLRCRPLYLQHGRAAQSLSLPDAGPAIIGLAEAFGLRVFLGTEPAIRLGQGRVAAASLQMIDAPLPGQAGAHRQLALDAAARRHDGIVREQRRAYFAILVGPAGIP